MSEPKNVAISVATQSFDTTATIRLIRCLVEIPKGVSFQSTSHDEIFHITNCVFRIQKVTKLCSNNFHTPIVCSR
jgi:hypothetical protein